MQQTNRYQRSTLTCVLFLFCSYAATISAAINTTNAALKPDTAVSSQSSRPSASLETILQHNLATTSSQVGNDDYISLVPDFSTQKEQAPEWDDSLPSEDDGDEQNLSLANSILPDDLDDQLSDEEKQQLQQKREIFQNAVKALNQGKHQTFKKLSANLEGYPLKPYLDYYELRRYLAKASQKDVNEFIQNNTDLPVIPHLQKAWLKTLAKKGEWSNYLSFYEAVTTGDPPLGISDASLNCYYHWAEFKNAKVDNAFAGAESLWLIGKTQDKACDPLFAKWQSSNVFNDDLIWQRITLAIANREFSLAQFLAKSLDSKQQKRVSDWIHLYRFPENLISKAPYLEDTIERNNMVFSVLMRLIDKDPVNAIEGWELFEAKINFSADQSQHFKTTLATILELRGLPEAEEWLLEANPDGNNELLNQLAIRRALTQSDWQKVAELIDKLPEQQKYSSQSRYWYARALEAIATQNSKTDANKMDGASQTANTAANNDTLQAEILYQQLASERGYYGFLASQRSKLPMSLVPMPVSIHKSEISVLKARPALQRAHEFYHLGQFANGRREWNAALSQMNDKEKLVAAKLASQWNWHSEAIRSASKSSYRDRISLRFPLAHGEIVAQQAKNNGLAVDWIYAIIRQESMFMSDARSPVGAMGMMQLLPSTARLVAKKAQLNYRGSKDLLNPETNIALGTLFMSQLMERFNNNIVLATAAYNAGPHRVDQWLANEHYPENIPGDIWIEMIPFKETRHYVKQVLSYQVIYQHLLGEEPDLLSSIQVISSNIDSNNITTATD